MIHGLTDGGETVSDEFLLSERQIERIKPYFPPTHGVPRVDDRRGRLHLHLDCRRKDKACPGDASDFTCLRRE